MELVLQEKNDEWMTYIDGEVRSACKSKGWAHQLRRKWSVRGGAVLESPVEDYEWKIIPGASGEQPEARCSDFDEGKYYVLSIDTSRGKFVLQHSTAHCGLAGPHWSISTYSEIDFVAGPGPNAALDPGLQRAPGTLPPQGWLRDHLVYLTNQFAPNQFSIT